jgi:hypothetical protein
VKRQPEAVSEIGSGMDRRNGPAHRRPASGTVVLATWAHTHPSLSDADEPTRDFRGLAAVLAAQEVSIAREARYRDLPADARPMAGRVSAPLVMARGRALPMGPCAPRFTSAASTSSRQSGQRRRVGPGKALRLARRIALAGLLLAAMFATTLLVRAAVLRRLAWDCPGCVDGTIESSPTATSFDPAGR